MPDTPVTPVNGVHGLGGTKDAELRNVPPGYTVYQTDKNLQAAKDKYPTYDWFACFRVKQGNNDAGSVSYTIVFDRPASQKQLFYFYEGEAHEVQYGDAPNKGNKPRSQATIPVGDPPIGMT